MTVSELISLLQTKPQGALVAYYSYSDLKLLGDGDISIEEMDMLHPDGPIKNKHPDVQTQMYLLLPGN